MHSEEIEVQIKIAELRADIQIALAISIGFFAAVVAVVAMLFQVIASEDVILAVVLTVLEVFLAVGCYKAVNKLKVERKELGKLREKYEW